MNEYYIFIICVFIIGCCLGSFLSVLINRTLSHKKGIIIGHSECPKCHHRLGILNLIPIFSWLFQLGRCTNCKKSISIQYPLLELSSGILSVIAFITNPHYIGGIFWLTLIYLILINCTLLAISFSDIKKHQIPNIFLITWIILCLPAIFLTSKIYDFPSIAIALTTNLLFFGGQYYLSNKRWLGSGDIFISIGMAFLLGWQKNLVAIFFAYILGSIISILLICFKKAKTNSAIAFGPFLALGTLIALYFGNEIIIWYSNFTFLT